MGHEHLILAINPGNTSTKTGLFSNDRPIWQLNIQHADEELSKFPSFSGQRVYRLAHVRQAFSASGHELRDLSCCVGRGGLLKPLRSGTYRVNEAMLDAMTRAERGDHASNLGAVMAHEIAAEVGIPAFIVDPVSVDEMDDIARVSGLADIERESLTHALNTKATAKRHARRAGSPYASLRLVVAHLGSGISITAHREGRMVDVVNPREEGPFSPDRAGGVPCMKLLELIQSGKYDVPGLKKRLFGEGGLYSYLGTKDFRKVMERVDGRDAPAALLVQAMAYQIAKHIAAMAAVLEGRVDAIILTGGMAHEVRLIGDISKRVTFIGPVFAYPGEDELQALAEGALRVLTHEEPPLEYQ